MARNNDPVQNDLATQYAAAKVRNTNLAADVREESKVIERLKKEKLQGSLISINDVTETLIMIASKTKAQLMRMLGELPQRMEGLPAARIENMMRKSIDDILLELSIEFTSNINIDSEEFKIADIVDDDNKIYKKKGSSKKI